MWDKKTFLVWQMIPFRRKKQTSENVADTTIKDRFYHRIRSSYFHNDAFVILQYKFKL